MKANTVHTILGFYSSGEGDPKRAYEAARSAKAQSVLLIDSADHASSFSFLRIEGETLIVATSSTPEVERVIKALESTGSPAIFVLHEDLALPPDTSSASVGSVFARLHKNEIVLDEVRRDISAAARMGRALTASAEWILDNSYLVRTQLSEIRRHLPRNFPKTPGGNGYASALNLARALVIESDRSLSEANITEHLETFQKTTPLTTAALWFFPLFLRMALVDELAILATAVNRSQQLREAAYLWANRLASSARFNAAEVARMIALLEKEAISIQPYFVTSLAEQLQDEEGALAPMQAWIQDHFQTSLTELVRREHTQEAAQRVSVANAFGSLRMLSRVDFTEIFEKVSLVEKELCADPSGIYSRSDFVTRDECRRVVERISRNSNVSEIEVARRAVALAQKAGDARNRHVAYFLLTDAVRQLEADTKSRVPYRIRLIRFVRRHATGGYVGGIACLTAAFLTLALVLAWEGSVHGRGTLAVLGILALFPLSELAQQIVNVLVIALLPPDTLPKLDFRTSGIPPEDATLVVIPMMLAGAGVVRREIEKLEVRFLANRDNNLHFGLFSDFVDAQHESASGDDGLLKAACEGIERLNARYPGGRFLLFHRQRSWSETERQWIGRERKRGKIEDLNRFLLGEGAGDILIAGKLPARIRYVITLDADTQLPPGTARRMVETIAHPLNQVEIDPVTHTRTRGFSIIQPRVSISLPSATATRFTRIFADTSGTDPYCKSVSDAQQDLFGEGIFHGKAIYDVRAFHETVGGRFPAETLLSHDLIEGSFAGVALASDIELFENLPLDYVSYCKRMHRWIRGDWQIAPWIFSHVPSPRGKEANPLSWISRFRIFDNLRRSLVPIASLSLLLFGWLASPAPGVWSLLIGTAIAILALAPLLDRLARHIQGEVEGWSGASDELVRSLVMIAFLPHQAWVAVDAILRAIYRRISGRRLLEWQTAEATGAEAHRHVSTAMQQMLGITGLSVLLMIVLQDRGALAPTFAFLALWAASPALMRWINNSAPLFHHEKIDVRLLRHSARRTWRFFDDLVNGDRNWLPPDNTQLALRVEVAERTSPTNIGLWLTSALSATDLGYLTVDDFLSRAANTMRTLSDLERYEGHLLNWYDTKSKQPLQPRYVSTVDSGNFLASLWVIERGCQELLAAPVLDRRALKGVADTLAVLREASGQDPSLHVPLRAMRRILHGKTDGYQVAGQLRMVLMPVKQLTDGRRWHEEREERSYWVAQLARDVSAWIDVIERYLGWMETLSTPPDSFLQALGPNAVKDRRRAVHAAPSLTTLAEGKIAAVDSFLAWRGTPDLRPEVASWLDQLASEYQRAKVNAAETVKKMREFSDAARDFGASTKMGLLYDHNRRLFGVGYAVGGPLEFPSHYDLLASECRLASLVSIAKGDVPIEHWQAMSRPLASSPGGRTLLSWSGTMFEYLMPLLYTRSFSNSLLDYACKDAVQRQIAYGEEKGVPWGISESAYSAIDANQTYQYRAFGVPGLALKPGTPQDLVVSPYSTMLALMVDPEASIANLRRLASFDLQGPMGLYESIDFSLENKRDGKRGVVTYAYMAHHQGMSLVALNNLLHRDVMQERFHSDVRIRAVESLLFERLPIAKLPPEEAATRMAPVRTLTNEDPAERVWKEDTPVPRVHLQGNGRYSLMITNSGGGYSRSNSFDVSRWRSDTTLDTWGSFVYMRDLRSDALWSATYHPVGGKLGSSSATFSADRAEFHRNVLGIESTLDVTVAAEDEVELRRLTISNRTLRSRQLELTSYVELSLAPHKTDTAHPAFAKMFVETEVLGEDTLIAHRRLRGPEDAPIWCAHIIVGATGRIQRETDRALFLGRGNGVACPDALRRELSGSAGDVLDPIFSLRCGVNLEARDRLEISFLTMTAVSREALLVLIEKYKRPEAVARAFEMAWTRAQLEFRYLGIGPATSHRFQELASHLIYPNARLRPLSERLAQNRLGQSALWTYGISGDLPMLAVTIADIRNLPLIRELLLAHNYWRLRGFRCDLIILNQETASYDRPLQIHLMRQIDAHSSEAGVGTNKPGGVFLRDWSAMPEEHRNLLLATASVVLSGQRGSLKQQLASSTETQPPAAFVPSSNTQEQPSLPLPFLELPYFNGLGGFTQDGAEYAVYLKPGSNTPTSWSNVMANPNFGTLVTESGLGCTWSGNSQTNRLTPWQNDPVADPQSEVIYMRDDESGAVWSPTPLPVREKDAYRAKHGQGYTVYEHNSHSIGQELTVFVPPNDPVKIYRLRLRNDSTRARTVTAIYYAEWVLGSTREDQQLNVHTSYDEASGAVMAAQTWTGSFTKNVAFAASSPRAASHTGDRTQFLGRNNNGGKPFALGRMRLDNRTGAGLDPAAALQVSVSLEKGQQVDLIFLLGETESADAMRAIVERYNTPRLVEDALNETRQTWDTRLSRLRVRTPMLSADFLVNRWLPYQALSCRFWGRTAMQQSSGAFGFRDQLQDSLAFLYTAPELTRAHLLAAAARQFLEGDVQHWWHAETGLGVRTRCSDDMAWLAFVTAHYVSVTGDTGILDERIPFLDAPPLEKNEQEKMFVPAISSQEESLLEHCRRALQCAWKLGQHGLPLFGTGDWNDGMNRVGVEGKGESVWLGWFLCAVLNRFAPIIEARDPTLAAAWREQFQQMAATLERVSWDGEWYLRGFFDDGTPLGSHANEEAKIDSIAQSWAVISEAANPLHARQAMESSDRLLVDERDRLVKLFTPPFDHSKPHPGYIMGYPQGVRENGGQYTHGSLWLASAWARMGEGDKAVRLLKLMNPVEASRTPETAEHFGGEPYVSPADVSSSAGRTGRAGWTWYTGSAGWMYRIWVEEVLGFQLRGEVLTVKPAIPKDWDGFEITYKYRSATYEISVRRSTDDKAIAAGSPIQLVDDGATHKVTIRMGSVAGAPVEAPKEHVIAV